MRFVHALGLIGIGAAVALGGGRSEDGSTDRVARLIDQLGHPRYATREAASRELDAIGEPALGTLRKAAATSADPEVGRRAELIVRTIAGRLRAEAAARELARFEGEWEGIGQQKLIIRDGRWAWGNAGPWQLDRTHTNRIVIVEVGDKVTRADLLVGDPAAGGRVCRAIFRLDGETLDYCGTYDAFYPAEFRTTENTFHVAWKRIKK
ncbi:MAG: hypothetical protein J2P46_01900 [Zavarzinella sp.]|nr:hypothetical protein [Zavarzinella sp.]